MKLQAIKRTLIPGTLIALTWSLAHLFGQTETKDQHRVHGVYPAAEIQWAEAPPELPPGAKVAVLEGDLTKDGPFTVRLRVPDGYRIAPHTHPLTEHLTVISGTMKIAMGDRLERSAAHTLSAGSFAMMPAGMKHAVWFEGETIIQGHGSGLWGITYLNPTDDPRNAKK